MSNFNISGPGPAGGDGFNKTDHVGHLMVFMGAVRDERKGEFGPYTVAVCDCVVCATCAEAFEDMPISGAALAPAILNGPGDVIVGVLDVGTAQPGKKAPFVLSDPDADQIDEINKLLTQYAGRMPSGKVIFDAKTFNADNAPKQ